jgi:hypothetical protein
MANVSSHATVAKPEATADDKRALLQEVRTKWDKFSEQDTSSLRGKDDLVTQIVAKYGLDKAQALRDVDALLNGRQI